jgi:hypothetical protein
MMIVLVTMVIMDRFLIHKTPFKLPKSLLGQSDSGWMVDVVVGVDLVAVDEYGD